MKKINIIYIAAFAVGFVLWRISSDFNRQSLLFYGFAENKETEINLEHSVEVNKIYVTTGQKVKQGTVLAEVEQPRLPQKQNEASYKIEELKAEQAITASGIKAEIGQLRADKARKIGEIENEIVELKAKVEENKQVLKNIGVEGGSSRKTDIKIAALEEEKRLIAGPYDIEIQELKDKLRGIGQPRSAQIKSLENEMSFYEEKEGKLSITAPSDGLIGNIHIKEAENVSAFNTLITFYEENPTSVQGFVHESMILQVAVGDTLEVVSSLHRERSCQGIVTGLGSRIVEIPSRLRKMPDLKNYGREVLISIPKNNKFLQKEKVILKISEKKEAETGIFPFLFGQSSIANHTQRISKK